MNMRSSKRPPLPVPKPVRWVASSKQDLSAFPNEVKTRVGGALWDAQIGLKSPAAKPLKGSATPGCSR
jgi:phage-related protein